MIWYVNDIPQKRAHTHTWYAIISTIAPLPSALETKDSAVSVIMFYRLRIDVKTSEVKRKFKTKLIFLSLTCTLSGENFLSALYQL